MDSPENKQQGPALVPFEAYVNTQEKASDEIAEAENRANFDAPTGVLQGKALENIINARIHELMQTVTNPEDSTLAAVVVDVTGLKELNTAIGHPAATEVLGEIAQLLQQSFRSEDATGLVGRTGGDEFLTLLDLKPREISEDGKGLEPQQKVKTAMERVLPIVDSYFQNHVNETIRKLYETRRINVAMGYSVWRPGWDTRQLVEEADADMYKNKSQQHAERDRLSQESRTEEQRAVIERAQQDLRKAGLEDLASRLS